MGDNNPFDRHPTYNDQQYNLDRDADPSLSCFSSDLYSPYMLQDSTQIPAHGRYSPSTNAIFSADNCFDRFSRCGERVERSMHRAGERQYYSYQRNWTSPTSPSAQSVGTNPSVVNRWSSTPQTSRQHPYLPYGFYTNSLAADQPSSSSISFQDQSYYPAKTQDYRLGSVSHYASPDVFDAPYMFASNQEGSSSSLQPTASRTFPIFEPEAEPTSPSESGSQRSTPGASSVESSGLPAPYMGPLHLGKLTACQHCRRRKIKCERLPGNDRCQQCIKRDLPECISDESRRGKWIRKKSKKD